MQRVAYIFLVLSTVTSVARARGATTNPDAYQTSIDGTAKAYDNSTKAVNSGAYDDYLKKLDTSYDSQVANINAGGNGGNAKELPKFVPTKADATSTSTTAATAETTSATAAAPVTAGPNATAGDALMNFCRSTCNAIKEEQARYACSSDCAQGAAAAARKPEENSADLMMLAGLLTRDE